MSGKIITISREFGSGGRTIGKMLAERLDIPCYDQELLVKIAEKSGFCEDYIRDRGEYATYPSALGNLLARHNTGGISYEDEIWKIQCELIREIADKGPSVIVGRCADYLLRDREDLLKVFIHAPFDFRAHRIVNVYGETDIAPEKRLKDKDRRRREYYRFYTDTEWGVARNYDIALDSARFGIERCVDILAGLAADE